MGITIYLNLGVSYSILCEDNYLAEHDARMLSNGPDVVRVHIIDRKDHRHCQIWHAGKRIA